MTDYNKYLDGLMAECRRSLQSYSHQLGSAMSLPPIRIRGPPTIAAAPAAYFPNNVLPAAAAPRPFLPGPPSSPGACPQPEPAKDLPLSAAVAIHPNVNENGPRAASAPRSASPRDPSPAATARSPFVPLFQLPIDRSLPACASQTTQETTTPSDYQNTKQHTRKDCAKEEADEGFHIRHQDLGHRDIRQEAKARGLICYGRKADLVARLDKDDRFQAEPRTADDYDTMSLKELERICIRRAIPSQGPFSSLKDRVKAHDKRGNVIEVSVAGFCPPLAPGAPLSALKVNDSREIIGGKPLLQIKRDAPAFVAKRAKDIEKTAETVPLAESMHEPTDSMLPVKEIHYACNHCRKGHVSKLPSI